MEKKQLIELTILDQILIPCSEAKMPKRFVAVLFIHLGHNCYFLLRFFRVLFY
jgi:hypothetical protein